MDKIRKHIQRTALIGIILVLSIMLFSSCATGTSNSGHNSVSNVQINDNNKNDETEIPEFEFNILEGDRGRICYIYTNRKEAKNKVMKIPDSYDGAPVVLICNSGFNMVSKFKTLLIPGSVEKLSDYAFSDCPDLKTVKLENGVEVIEEYAFSKCPLSDVHIPASVKTIADNSFNGCKNMTIYAPSGSYAEEYAKNKNIPFVAE